MWSSGWPDWHQLWCTHADSSRKGSWRGGLGLGGGGAVGGQKFKSEKAHVNTHMHINLQRVVGQLGGGGGEWGGGVGGQKFKSQKKHM